MQKIVRTTKMGGYDGLQEYLDDGWNVIMCNRICDDLEYVIDKKETNKKERKTNVNVKKSYGEFGHVKLSDEEYDKLMNTIPKLQDWIKKCDEYIESTNKPYKSHYLTIKRWYEKEQNKNSNNNNSKDFLSGVDW